MTDNSSNFLSLEVVFQKKVSLQRHTAVNAYRLPVISSLWPQNKKSLLWYKHEHLMGQKSLTKKSLKIRIFPRNGKILSIWFMISKGHLWNELWRNLKIQVHYDVKNLHFFAFWTFWTYQKSRISIFQSLFFATWSTILISSGKLNRKIVW